MRGDMRCDQSGLGHDIVVHEKDELPAGFGDAKVARSSRPPMWLLDGTDTVRWASGADPLDGAVSRSIVDDDKLHVTQRMGLHG
jgi:hypothetical protein